MANLSLQKYEQDGLELYVDESTGLAYAHQSAIARMLGVPSGGTLQRRLETTSKDLAKTAEIITPQGIRTASFYPAQVVAKLAIEFAPALAEKMLEAGANVFMLGLAGYQIKPQLPQTYIEALEALVSSEKKKKNSG